jgi:hypothetical protein
MREVLMLLRQTNFLRAFRPLAEHYQTVRVANAVERDDSIKLPPATRCRERDN